MKAILIVIFSSVLLAAGVDFSKYAYPELEYKSSLDIKNEEYAVTLGKLLYHKPTSISRTSCAQCHAVDKAGHPPTRLPEGGGNFRTLYNREFARVFGRESVTPTDKPLKDSPMVANSYLLESVLWEGLEDEFPLELQVIKANDGHFMNDLAVECRMDNLFGTLSLEAFDRPLDFEVVKAAISMFEQSIITTETNLNKFIEGRSDKLVEPRGLALYDAMCFDCHNTNKMSPALALNPAHEIVKTPRLENARDNRGFFHTAENITMYKAIKRHDLGLSRSDIYTVMRFLNKDYYDSELERYLID